MIWHTRNAFKNVGIIKYIEASRHQNGKSFGSKEQANSIFSN